MKRLILIVLSFFFLTTPALAGNSKSDMWIVSQRSGDARVVHRGIQPASLKVNSSLAPGDVVITGATGRATLARGSDYIVIAPRSELRLPASEQASGFTRVVQQLGTMLFKVKHTGVPHFAVDTPMLAAVVKGTTFTVVVDQDRSAVQVIEGAVQVTATEGGMQQLVEGGKTVFIDRINPKQLITADAQTLGASESTSETSVRVMGTEGESVSAIADLTGGLVQAEAIVLAANTSPANIGALSAPIAPTDESGTPSQPGSGTTVDSPTGTVAPIFEPVVDTLPVVDAVVAPIVTPVADVVVTPVVDAVVAPVVDAVVVPVVDAVVAPVVDAVVVPVVDAVVAPVVDAVVVPVVDAVVAPIVAPVVDAIVSPVTEIVGSLFGGL